MELYFTVWRTLQGAFDMAVSGKAMESFDLIVVGTGAGGSGVATRCAKAGWQVAVIDDEPYGGT